MKTTPLVISIIVIIVAGFLGYWLLSQKPSAGTEGASATAENSDAGAMQNQNAPGIGEGGGAKPAPSDGSAMDDNLLLGTDASASHGTYLIGWNGMTLYTYSKDSAGVSACSAGCAQAWPPYTITSIDVLTHVQAGISGKVGFITRDDGRMQVTYNGLPLYFWVQDKASGDVNGDGVGGFALAHP